jgi:osmoprotectant transport system substrate-binding protein
MPLPSSIVLWEAVGTPSSTVTQPREGVLPSVGALRSFGLLAFAGLSVTLVGCGSQPQADGRDSALGDRAITVASFDFPESELLAELYAQALETGGFDTRLEPRLGPRELVQPALASGLVEFVPEYSGTALEFLSLGAAAPTADAGVTRAALRRTVDHDRIVALEPAPAQNANAVVVSRELADRYDLDEVSDLEDVAPRLTIGGPPECPTRPFCLAGLERVYGLRFESFLPLDAGGPLTHQALAGGHVDVAVLFTSDPKIDTPALAVLDDDRRLQPAENVVPLVRAEIVERWGDDLVRLVDGVSARLTTDDLRALNARVAAGESPAAVAERWLDGEGVM